MTTQKQNIWKIVAGVVSGMGLMWTLTKFVFNTGALVTTTVETNRAFPILESKLDDHITSDQAIMTKVNAVEKAVSDLKLTVELAIKLNAINQKPIVWHERYGKQDSIN